MPKMSLCVALEEPAHLHLKAGFAFVHAIVGFAPRPEVSKALHGERWGTVAVPRHLKVQVAVV